MDTGRYEVRLVRWTPKGERTYPSGDFKACGPDDALDKMKRALDSHPARGAIRITQVVYHPHGNGDGHRRGWVVSKGRIVE